MFLYLVTKFFCSVETVGLYAIFLFLRIFVFDYTFYLPIDYSQIRVFCNKAISFLYNIYININIIQYFFTSQYIRVQLYNFPIIDCLRIRRVFHKMHSRTLDRAISSYFVCIQYFYFANLTVSSLTRRLFIISMLFLFRDIFVFDF